MGAAATLPSNGSDRRGSESTLASANAIGAAVSRLLSRLRRLHLPGRNGEKGRPTTIILAGCMGFHG